MSTEQSQLQDYMRLPAEVLYREELEALRRKIQAVSLPGGRCRRVRC